MIETNPLYQKYVYGGKTMVNAKGDWIYSCAEIGAALGINPNTVRAGAKRLFGNSFRMEFTLDEARKIKAYFESITAEQEEMRIRALFDALQIPFEPEGMET